MRRISNIVNRYREIAKKSKHSSLTRDFIKFLRKMEEYEADPLAKYVLFNGLYESWSAEEGEKDSFWEDWGQFIHRLADKTDDPVRKKELLLLSAEKYEKSSQCLPVDRSKNFWSEWGKILQNIASLEDSPVKKYNYLKLSAEKYAVYQQIDPSHHHIQALYGICLFDLAELESDTGEKEKLQAAAKSSMDKIHGHGSELFDMADRENNPAQKKWLMQYAFENLDRITVPGKIDNSGFCEYFFWTTWKRSVDALAAAEVDIDGKRAVFLRALKKFPDFVAKDSGINGAWAQWRNCLLDLVRLESSSAKKQRWIQELDAVAEKWARMNDSLESWIGWGDSLLALADITPDLGEQTRLARAALVRYARAADLGPDSVKAWRFLGIGLLRLARLEPDPERKRSMLKDARVKFENALARDTSDSNAAARNLGNTLTLLAESSPSRLEASALLASAESVYAKALSLKAEEGHSYPGLWIGYGRVCLQKALLAQGQTKPEESGALFTEAREKLETANKLDSACGSYTYACLELALGNKAECQRRLAEAQEHGELPHSTRLRSDPLLREIQEENWFMEIITNEIKREANRAFND
jgi:hypothetical protein